MRPGGEYREEGEKDRSKWELQAFFLEKVGALAPKVLKDLQSEILPVYRQAHAATQPDPVRSEANGPFGDDTVSRQSPEWVQWKFRDEDWEQAGRKKLLALRTQLRGWAEDHSLLEPWVLDAALRTLFFWYHGDASCTTVADRLSRWRTIYSENSIRAVFANLDVEKVTDVFRVWRERVGSPELRFYPLHFQDAFAVPPFTFEFPSWVPQEKLWSTYKLELRDAGVTPIR